ncbi:MAG: RNA methyltransferase [Bacilli bacterium]|nr:RNA methyltransferase [Bacilli bacterium]
MIYKISSKNNDKVKYFAALKENSTRNKEKKFIVEGFHLLEMALEKKCVDCIISLKEIKNVDSSIDQYIVSEEVLLKISSTKSPQGVLAVCNMNAILNNGSYGDKVLFLDDVQDPGNVGTIIRTALAFNFKTIILGPQCCSIFNDKVLSATQGGIFFVNFVTGNIDTLKKLKDDGYQIVATALRNSVLLNEYTPMKKQVIIMGNEARGVAEEIQDISDVKVRIEIQNIESLNVGVATGVMLQNAIERTPK